MKSFQNGVEEYVGIEEILSSSIPSPCLGQPATHAIQLELPSESRIELRADRQLSALSGLSPASALRYQNRKSLRSLVLDALDIPAW